MSEAAKKYLKDYCERNYLSVGNFSRLMGLSKDAVYRFLTGRINDLKLSTAIQVADRLDISLDELTNRKDYDTQQADKQKFRQEPCASSLYKDVTFYVSDYIIKRPSITYLQATSATDSIYEYCLRYKDGTVDKSFASWFLDNLK